MTTTENRSVISIEGAVEHVDYDILRDLPGQVADVSLLVAGRSGSAVRLDVGHGKDLRPSTKAEHIATHKKEAKS